MKKIIRVFELMGRIIGIFVRLELTGLTVYSIIKDNTYYLHFRQIWFRTDWKRRTGWLTWILH